mmetsp:Transcript_13857/g.18069  ORF Transcript_13857/g.18069 Transcript_13857/m.18069 type:complete len:80 (+) Transcript_13857:59-298(+)
MSSQVSESSGYGWGGLTNKFYQKGTGRITMIYFSRLSCLLKLFSLVFNVRVSKRKKKEKGDHQHEDIPNCGWPASKMMS